MLNRVSPKIIFRESEKLIVFDNLKMGASHKADFPIEGGIRPAYSRGLPLGAEKPLEESKINDKESSNNKKTLKNDDK